MSNPPTKKTNWVDNTTPKGFSPSHMQAWLNIVARLRAEEAKRNEATKLMDRYQAGMMLVGVDQELEEACWKIKLANEGREAQYESLKAEGKLDDTSPLKHVFRHLYTKKSQELATINAQIMWLESGKAMLETDEDIKQHYLKKDRGDKDGSSGTGGAGMVF